MRRALARSLLGWAVLLLLAPPVHGQPSLSALDDRPDLQVRLPGELREISGLAWHPAGYLLAHDDERGIVYSLDPDDPSEIVGRATLPRPERVGDYEGIAVLDAERIALVTSAGRIVTVDPNTGEGEAWDTGLARICEVEGLAVDPPTNDLLILCKTVYDREDRNALLIFRASSIDPDAAPTLHRIVPPRTLRDADLPRPFLGSGLEVVGDELFVLSARRRRLLRLNAEGAIVEVGELSKRRHAQAEGITVDPSGHLWIADEGGEGRARLARYTLSSGSSR